MNFSCGNYHSACANQVFRRVATLHDDSLFPPVLALIHSFFLCAQLSLWQGCHSNLSRVGRSAAQFAALYIFRIHVLVVEILHELVCLPQFKFPRLEFGIFIAVLLMTACMNQYTFGEALLCDLHAHDNFYVFSFADARPLLPASRIIREYYLYLWWLKPYVPNDLFALTTLWGLAYIWLADWKYIHFPSVHCWRWLRTVGLVSIQHSRGLCRGILHP